MATDTPESESRPLVATCPSCGARCRLRKEAPHGSARCPRCGAALALAKRPSANNADKGQDESAISAVEKPARRPTPPPLKVEPEEEPAPPPDLPAHPLLQGVYGYPWRLEHLRAWFLFGLGFSIVALLGAAVCHIIILHQQSSEVGRNMYFRVLILFVKGLVVFLFWTGMFAAPYVLAVIQDTAAGNEDFQAPDTTLGEKLIDFLYLLWISFFALVPTALAAVALARLTHVPLLGFGAVLLFVVLFPQLLLGSLVNDSAMMLLSEEVLTGLLRRPLVLVGFTLASALVLAPAAVLAVVTVLGLQYFLAPVAGYVIAASALIYARLLGRVGWVLTHDGKPVGRGRRRKKRKRPAAE